MYMYIYIDIYIYIYRCIYIELGFRVDPYILRSSGGAILACRLADNFCGASRTIYIHIYMYIYQVRVQG